MRIEIPARVGNDVRRTLRAGSDPLIRSEIDAGVQRASDPVGSVDGIIPTDLLMRGQGGRSIRRAAIVL